MQGQWLPSLAPFAKGGTDPPNSDRERHSFLFFRARGAEGGICTEQDGFGGVEGFEFYVGLAVGSDVDDGAEVVDLTGLGREAGGGGEFGEAPETRLPLGADAMVAGIDGKVKIRIAVVGSDPRAVNADTDRDRAKVDAGAGADGIEDVDHGFAGFGLRGGMLISVGLDIEFDIVGAASRGARERGGILIILGVSG